MSKLQSQVIDFMKLGNQAIEPVPTIPSRPVVSLRVELVVEEAMEFFESCYGNVPEVMMIQEMVRNVMRVREPRVDLAKAADALGDLDYVVEGARLAFGIDGESVADEIHSTNMKKVEGKVALLASGKVGKPSQWVKPDIEGVLFKQNAGELPSVRGRLREVEEERPAKAEEKWGVWVSGGCDRDSDDDWISDGTRPDFNDWTGTEAEARAYAEALSKDPQRGRFTHEARRYRL